MRAFLIDLSGSSADKGGMKTPTTTDSATVPQLYAALAITFLVALAGAIGSVSQANRIDILTEHVMDLEEALVAGAFTPAREPCAHECGEAVR